MTNRLITYSSVVLALLALGAFFAFQAHANPSYFPVTVETNSATGTFAYLSPGAATTTLTFNAYANASSPTKADSATVVFQYTASGTAPILKARIERSQDGIDWYPVSVTTVLNATTSIMTTFSEYTFNLATSTSADFLGSGTSQRVHESFTIETPTRFTRVKFYVPASGGNGGLWAQIIPTKERPE